MATYKLRAGGKQISITENLADKIVSWVDPVRAMDRLRARAKMAMVGGYTGGSRSRRGLSDFNPKGGSADADILPDLPTLRERSRDLIRNTPLATGAIKTKITNVVGTGLKLQSNIDRDILALDDAQAEALEHNIEKEWDLWWGSHECHAGRALNGNTISRLIYRQVKENGDVLALMPRIKRPGISPYALKVQVIEADRLCNADSKRDTLNLSGGVLRDDNGVPQEYHILKVHPGEWYKAGSREWEIIPAYGPRTGIRNVIHLFQMDRPGQSRGVPDLAPVVETLKQLARYTDAEIMAAVVSGMFTTFINSEEGDADLGMMTPNEGGATSADEDYKLGYGTIVGLAPGEEITTANPTRPNAVFDEFVMSVMRQVGVALEIPFEILVKHFQSSYSAARAALLDFWHYVFTERKWFSENFHQLVFETFMFEAVALGRVSAPGFLSDPLLRRAYCGAEWIGPAKGMIDELKEVDAAGRRIELGISTHSEVTAELTGGDWERKHVRLVKEKKMRRDDGLEIEENSAFNRQPQTYPSDEPLPAKQEEQSTTT